MKDLKDNEISTVSGGSWFGAAKSAIDWAGRGLTVKEIGEIAVDKWNELKNDKSEDPTYGGGFGSYKDLVGDRNDRDNSSRVICTHFYQKGMLSRELWRADMEYTLKHLPQSMVNGYHLWAIPYVRLMRKSPLAEKLMYPIAYHRAREIAYQMGYISKGSIRGKVFRAILEPICLFLGIFTKEHKYQELWRKA